MVALDWTSTKSNQTISLILIGRKQTLFGKEYLICRKYTYSSSIVLNRVLSMSHIISIMYYVLSPLHNKKNYSLQTTRFLTDYKSYSPQTLQYL